MFLKNLSWSTMLLLFSSIAALHSHRVVHYNLVELLKNHGLVSTMNNQQMQILDSPKNQAISIKGIVWLKGVTFKEGTIDIDLKAKNVLDLSFAGIAFHGVDTNTFNAVYFRPFNFHIADTLRRKHAVQYVCYPDYSWKKLRINHPLVYEHPVYPVPESDKWFHATIVVNADSVAVYVNHAKTASLKVKKLDSITEGKIGLWTFSDGVSGDFANLIITQ